MSEAGGSPVRITYVGGPTALVEVAGLRLLTDPVFGPAGGKYSFGLGTGSVKLDGPALAAGELGRIDAVLLTHDHHDDNLDPAGRALLPSAGVVHHGFRSEAAGRSCARTRGRDTTTLEADGRRSRSRPRRAATAHP